MKYVFYVSFVVLFFTAIVILSLRQVGLQRQTNSQDSWFEREKMYWLIAQGGGEGLGPGHSKEALKQVERLSSDIVLEVELKRTLDNHWILYGHDRLEVQTEGEGFVSWKKWDEMKHLNLGFRFKNKKGDSLSEKKIKN